VAKLYRFDRVGSTMEVIHQLAAEGAEAGTIVIATEQVEGRGSRGRPWYSSPGGLWLSTLVRPPGITGIEVISLRVGLSVSDALEPLIGRPVRLKWPNDLMIGERKVGGILCEARWQGAELSWVAVGLGINVRNQVSAELSRTATTLTAEHPQLSLEETTEAIVTALQQLDFPAELLSHEELQRFAHRDWLRGRLVDSPVVGTVLGISSDGALVIGTADGSQRAVRSGSVELAPASPTR
jgi:BirA family biotin operon repressor/biotin-[acetyl-CoA-carboxylase] ligase